MFGIAKKYVRHEIMLGLNDKDTKIPMMDTVEAYKAASGIVARYYDGATIYKANGIYKHDDGTVIFEPSLKIDIIVFSGPDNLPGLINELKKFFNQECIALQTSRVSSRLV